jgi:hypothetical protein
VYVPQPRRGARLLLAAGPAQGSSSSGSSSGTEGAPVVVASAARLMQHPALLVGSGLGRYMAHAPLQGATVLQGAEGLRGAHFARGFALQQPVLLVTEAAAVLFSAGGLEAVLVLPLGATGGPVSQHGSAAEAACLAACLAACAGTVVWQALMWLSTCGEQQSPVVFLSPFAETDVRYSSHEVSLFSPAAAPAGRPEAAAAAAVLCRLSRDAWLRMAPLLRRRAGGGS